MSMTTRPIIGAVNVFDHSPSAASCARWLARESGAPVELVYVFDRGRMPALPRLDPERRRRLRERYDERVLTRAIETLATIASGSPGIRTSATVLDGRRVPLATETCGGASGRTARDRDGRA